MAELVVNNALELLEAKREGRRPVPEAVVDEWPRRAAVRILEHPAITEGDGAVYDGRDI